MEENKCRMRFYSADTQTHADLSGRLAGLNQELAKRGESTFPPLPAELVNESYNPASRLLGLMRYVENLITDERRVIWIFYPLEISDPSAYFQLIGYLNGAARAGFKKTGRKSEFGALAGPLSRAWRYTTSRRLQSCAFGIEIIGDNQTAMEKSRESPIFPPPHSDP